ncbi:hypothetical protein H101_08023 [Trichophyton interdigitale H6]|nr:hypothetical protein H101_08023 [Trichophyton interdigitale H6]
MVESAIPSSKESPPQWRRTTSASTVNGPFPSVSRIAGDCRSLLNRPSLQQQQQQQLLNCLTCYRAEAEAPAPPPARLPPFRPPAGLSVFPSLCPSLSPKKGRNNINLSSESR